MRDFDWNLAASFLAVLQHGSLASAARAINISQPTLGRHIDELEAALEVTLFQRGRNGMIATQTALELAQSAQQMKRASKELSLLATGASQSVEGVVRVTASQIVATYLLPSILADLLKEMQQIEIELIPSNTVENLLQRDADIAIRMVRPVQNDLIARQIGQLTMGIYADRKYLSKTGTPMSIDDLKHHIIIGYDRDDLIIRGFEKNGIEVDRSFFRFRTDNQVTALEALIAGVGIGFAPTIIADRHSSLDRILKDYTVPSLPMWLVSHRELRTSRRIRAVYDWLDGKLSNGVSSHI